MRIIRCLENIFDEERLKKLEIERQQNIRLRDDLTDLLLGNSLTGME